MKYKIYPENNLKRILHLLLLLVFLIFYLYSRLVMDEEELAKVILSQGILIVLVYGCYPDIIIKDIIIKDIIFKDKNKQTINFKTYRTLLLNELRTLSLSKKLYGLIIVGLFVLSLCGFALHNIELLYSIFYFFTIFFCLGAVVATIKEWRKK